MAAWTAGPLPSTSRHPRAAKTSDLRSPSSRLGFRPTPAALYGHLNPCGKYRFDLGEDLHGAALRPLRTPGDNP